MPRRIYNQKFNPNKKRASPNIEDLGKKHEAEEKASKKAREARAAEQQKTTWKQDVASLAKFALKSGGGFINQVMDANARVGSSLERDLYRNGRQGEIDDMIIKQMQLSKKLKSTTTKRKTQKAEVLYKIKDIHGKETIVSERDYKRPTNRRR